MAALIASLRQHSFYFSPANILGSMTVRGLRPKVLCLGSYLPITHCHGWLLRSISQLKMVCACMTMFTCVQNGLIYTGARSSFSIGAKSGLADSETAVYFRVDFQTTRCSGSVDALCVSHLQINMERETDTDHPLWQAFEEAFLALHGHCDLAMYLDGSETTIQSLLEGNILAGLASGGRLKMYGNNGVLVTKDDILSAPAEHTVNGRTVTLTLLQRYHLLTRQRETDREEYLQSILATSLEKEQPQDRSADSHDAASGGENTDAPDKEENGKLEAVARESPSERI